MTLSSANLGLINPINVLPELSRTLNDGDQRQRCFELVNTLQSTLDLAEQLRIFKCWIEQNIAVEGLHYHQPQHHISIALGVEAKHHSHYRLTTDDENLGEIQFSRGKPFSEEELSQLETALSSLLYPVRNALRYHVAVETALRDPLTGTGNRIALDNALRRECQLAERYAQAVSLLVIDIDHFKNINDSFGHTVGDQVLKQVATAIRTVTRETDMTFRYGGEEFVVVLSKTNIDGANLIAERVRQCIEQQQFKTQSGNTKVTVSLGASTLQQKENIKNLFDRADHALYQAKSLGRNRVVSA